MLLILYILLSLYIRDTEDAITFILSITYNIGISIVIEKLLNSVE